MASAPSHEMVPFADATKVTRLDKNVYGANLVSAWCIGSVPNGGYVASVILRATSLHLTERGQPDAIHAHFEYVSRTEVGPAVLVVDEVKLGRGLSTLYITLYQHEVLTTAPWTTAASRRNVLAYVTNGRLSLEKGLTLKSGWDLTPPPKPVDFNLLLHGRDPHWVRRERLNARGRSFARAHTNLEHYAPREGIRRGMADLWLRFNDGKQRFTNASLGYVADAYPTIVEGWRPRRDEEQVPFRSNEMFWYPTLALNLDVKRALPEEGAEWLFIRVLAKVIRNGRLDLEVIVLDGEGNVVALSSHVNMILSAERNLKERSYAKPKI
ncbi:thioesterase family protein [Colletotrichum sojae]|uniref:Thioesterase family protein n=1 Tax=Colletotrichum sojae TaxID=2175907 RepID=A0A8H6JS21_9PEZI|nr:thioesterase family protein [Colletotrichum sojae]